MAGPGTAPGATDQTGYDRVRYPSGVYAPSDPSRLAALARIHGLAAPDPATARVLEIAGGDGANVIAMAAALPRAQFASFDLAPSAVADGQAQAAAAGLTNVRVFVGDVIECAETLTGPFDYIIAHGLYAWVPEPVRVATMRLIGRLLSEHGVGFVSYNALPGCYLRMAVRAMLLHHVRDEADPARRLALARECLAGFAMARPGDRPALAGLRSVAEAMLNKTDAVLFHDELGESYAPQLLTDVVDAAAAQGLAYLNDAYPPMIRDGLPGLHVAEADVVALAQADDFAVSVFFHRTLLVRAGRNPARGVVAAHFAGLFATTVLRPEPTAEAPGRFVAGEQSIEIDDPRLAEILTTMGKVAPWRLPIDALANSDDHCNALVELCERDLVVFHAAQLPAVSAPGPYPRTSALMRAQLAQGLAVAHSLDLRVVGLDDPGVRHFIGLLDGTRDRAALDRDWMACAWAETISTTDALDRMARAGMLVA